MSCGMWTRNPADVFKDFAEQNGVEVDESELKLFREYADRVEARPVEKHFLLTDYQINETSQQRKDGKWLTLERTVYAAQAQPDGGEAVDEVLMTCPRCEADSYVTPHESLYRHPAPAPDVARLVELARRHEGHDPQLREALAPFIAAQQEGATNGQE